MRIAYVCTSVLFGALVGLMMVGLFYKPGLIRGPTHRIVHLTIVVTPQANRGLGRDRDAVNP